MSASLIRKTAQLVKPKEKSASKWTAKNYEEIDTSDITFSSGSEPGGLGKLKEKKKTPKPKKYAFDTDTEDGGTDNETKKIGTLGSKFIKTTKPEVKANIFQKGLAPQQSSKLPVDKLALRIPQPLSRSSALDKLAKLESAVQARKNILRQGLKIQSDVSPVSEYSHTANSVSLVENETPPPAKPIHEKRASSEENSGKTSDASTPTSKQTHDDVPEDIHYSLDFTSEPEHSSTEKSTSTNSQSDTETQKSAYESHRRSSLAVHPLKQSSKSFSNLGYGGKGQPVSAASSASEDIVEEHVTLTRSETASMEEDFSSHASPINVLGGVRLMDSLSSVSSLSSEKAEHLESTGGQRAGTGNDKGIDKHAHTEDRKSKKSRESSIAETSGTSGALKSSPSGSKSQEYSYSSSDFETASAISKVSSEARSLTSSAHKINKSTKAPRTKNSKATKGSRSAMRSTGTQTQCGTNVGSSIGNGQMNFGSLGFSAAPPPPDNSNIWNLLAGTNPMAAILNDLMLHQTLLTKQFLDSSKYMRDAFMETLNADYNYITVVDVQRELAKNQRHAWGTDFGRTLKRVNEEMEVDKNLVDELRRRRTDAVSPDVAEAADHKPAERNDVAGHQCEDGSEAGAETNTHPEKNVDSLLHEYLSHFSKPAPIAPDFRQLTNQSINMIPIMPPRGIVTNTFLVPRTGKLQNCTEAVVNNCKFRGSQKRPASV